jgi:hypothetical protein
MHSRQFIQACIFASKARTQKYLFALASPKSMTRQSLCLCNIYCLHVYPGTSQALGTLIALLQITRAIYESPRGNTEEKNEITR